MEQEQKGIRSGHGRLFRLLALVALWSLSAAGTSSHGQDLADDYWIVARWEESESDANDKVIIDWGLSEFDLEGWAAPSAQVHEWPPYRTDGAGGGIYYDKAGEKWTLWDLERYDQDGLARYAAVWRSFGDVTKGDNSVLAEVRLPDGCVDGPAGCDIPAPAGYEDYELVDFELEGFECSEPRLRGLWRAGGGQGALKLRSMRLADLRVEDTAAQVVDIESCEKPPVDLESARYLVLLNTSAALEDTVVDHGDWCRLHDRLHFLEIDDPDQRPCRVHMLELESIETVGLDGSGYRECPVSLDDAGSQTTLSERRWEYLWVWQVRDDPDDCGTQKRDWLMASDRYSLLEQEVQCLNGEGDLSGFYGNEVCVPRALRLNDILIGADEIPDSDGDSQHPLGHGDGSGG